MSANSEELARFQIHQSIRLLEDILCIIEELEEQLRDRIKLRISDTLRSVEILLPSNMDEIGLKFRFAGLMGSQWHQGVRNQMFNQRGFTAHLVSQAKIWALALKL